MNNLIPQFIHENYLKDKVEGKIKATAMFMDLSGFTPITESLMQHGKEGAEILSSILNSIFFPVIDEVYKNDGFITGFAGDAFFAVFSGSKAPLLALHTAEEIRKIFKEKGVRKTRFGNFDLQVKMGLGVGTLNWGIIGPEKHKTYYFRGSAFTSCANCEKHCDKMQITFDEKFLHELGKINSKTNSTNNSIEDLIAYEKTEENYFKLLKNNFQTETIKRKSKYDIDISQKVLDNFFSEKIIKYHGAGELRNIVSVFISFKNITSYKKLDEMFCDILPKMDLLGGYLKNIDFGDKGATMLVVFGAPVSYENNIERACNFISAVKEKYKKNIRAGITYGTVYAGLIGAPQRSSYDVLGDTVNISCRLMAKVNWGSVWISQGVYAGIKNSFNCKFINEFQVRGRKQTVAVYELLDKRNISQDSSYRIQMVGREDEEKKLKQEIELTLSKKNTGIFYVYGEIGIGKSRFINEVIAQYKGKTNHCIFQCDSVIRKSLNPIIYFLKNFFMQQEKLKPKKLESNFNKVFTQFTKDLNAINDNRKTEIIEELNKNKIFIKAILGLDTKNTIYEELDPKLRFENTLYHIKNLLKGLSLIKPLIIELEDIHWIDEDSKRFFGFLSTNSDEYPYIIIATSRYNDDRSKPKLKINSNLKENEIELKNLKENSVKKMIKDCIGQNPDEKLFNFIKERTHQNPFYIEQFCFYLLENNFLKEKDNQYYLAIEPEGIPDTINFILTARIDRLSTELKELAQIAVILGYEFDANILLEMLKLIKESDSKNKNYKFDIDLINLLLKKEKAKHILEDGKVLDLWKQLEELKYTFKHSLLAQTIYDMQLRSRLRNIHKIAAETIIKLYKDQEIHYAETAYHYEKAEEHIKTKIYLEKAADYFKNLYQNKEALNNYEKLLKLLKSEGKKNENKINEISFKKAEILNLIGKWDEAISFLNERIDFIKEIEKENTKIKYNKIIFMELENLLGEVLSKKGEYDDALNLFFKIEEKIKTLKSDEAKKLYSEVIGNIGLVYYERADYDKAMKNFEEQRVLCKKIDNKKSYVKAISNIGGIYHDKGDYENAMKYYTETQDLCEKFSFKKEALETLDSIGVLHLDKGEYDIAKKIFLEQKKLAEELGDRSAYSDAVGNLGTAHSDMGDYKQAMIYLKEDREICEELGDKKNLSISICNLGSLYGAMGDYESAATCFQQDKDICKEIGNKYGYGVALGNIASTLRAKGEFTEAMKYYEEAKTLYTELGTKKMYSLVVGNIGNIYSAKGNYKEALKNYDEAIQIGREMNIKFYLCAYIRWKAEVLFEQEEFAKAKNLTDEALQLSIEVGDPDDTFRAKVLQAKLIAKLEDKEKALSQLFALLSEYEESAKKTARIHYEIWQLIGTEENKNKALEIYEEIYKKTPKYDFKVYIDNMKKA